MRKNDPTLRLSVESAAEVRIVAGLEKWRAGRYVPFEGSYGFGRDRVTTGCREAVDVMTMSASARWRGRSARAMA